MLSKFKIFLLVTLCPFFLISSCKSSKKQKTPESTILGSSINFKTFNASKVVFTIVHEASSININGSIKIKRDSILMLSMQPFLGLEVARFVATNEDFTIIDRLNKRYASMKMEDVKKNLGMNINFTILQSVLTNSIFAIDKEGQAVISDFSQADIAGLKLLQRTTDMFIQEFSVDNAYIVQSASINTSKEPYSIRWNYSKFEELKDGIKFPMEIKFTTYDGHEQQQIDILYKRIELDTDINIDTNIPSGYTKITAEELLKSITN